MRYIKYILQYMYILVKDYLGSKLTLKSAWEIAKKRVDKLIEKEN